MSENVEETGKEINVEEAKQILEKEKIANIFRAKEEIAIICEKYNVMLVSQTIIKGGSFESQVLIEPRKE